MIQWKRTTVWVPVLPNRLTGRFSLRALLIAITLFAISCPFLFPPNRTVTSTAKLLPPRGLATPAASQVYLETQLQLLRSQFVLNAALSRIPQSDLPKEIRQNPNCVNWLQQRLNVTLDAQTNATVAITSTTGTASQLQRLVDSIVAAYEIEVVAAERAEHAARKAGTRERKQST